MKVRQLIELLKGLSQDQEILIDFEDRAYNIEVVSEDLVEDDGYINSDSDDGVECYLIRAST